MLIEEDRKNIELIRTTAQKVWGEDCVFGDFKELNSPYPEFEWNIVLYGRFEVRIEYECGGIGNMVKTADGYITLSRLTDEQVFRGLKSGIPENLLHNFQVLDRLLKTYMD